MTTFDPHAAAMPTQNPDPTQLHNLLFGDDEEKAYRDLVNRKRAEERYRDETEGAKFAGVSRQTLRDLRASPPPPVEWTIEKLSAKGSITFVLGTFKSGKSSLIVNLLWCLADTLPFLCTYPVRRIEGAIGYFDFEMGVTETYDRLNRVGCSNDHKIYIYDMVAEGFDLRSGRSYRWLVDEINETGMEVIVLDALRHIAAKKDGNNDGEVQEIFTQLERLRKDCPSLQDVFIPTHTAKNDSARPGDDISALGSAAWDGGAQYRWGAYRSRTKDGWSYSFCLLPSRRTDPEAATPRQLAMDADGALSLGATGTAAASSAREEARRTRTSDILRFVAANEPTSKNKIHQEVGGARRDTLDLISSLHNRELWVEDGRSGAQVWTYQGYLNHLAQAAKPG